MSTSTSSYPFALFHHNCHFVSHNDASSYRSGKYSYWKGQYADALNFLYQAKFFFHESPSEIQLSNYYIGKCWYALGDFNAALQNHEKSLTVWQREVDKEGEVDFNRAACFVGSAIYNIGLCHFAKGDYRKAKESLSEGPDIEQFYREFFVEAKTGIVDAIKLIKSEIESSDAGNITLLETLEGLLKKYPGNRKIDYLAERDLGPVALCLNEKGELLAALGDVQGALELHQMALRIQKDMLGEKHPKLITTLNNIGKCMVALGHFNPALSILERAVGKHFVWLLQESKENFFKDDAGPIFLALESSDSELRLADTLSLIGKCLYSMGQYEKALQIQKRVLFIRLKIFNDYHPNIAETHDDLGNCYSSLCNLKQAQEEHTLAIHIRKKIYGFYHPTSANSYTWLGACYSLLEDYEGAYHVYLTAYQILERIGGDEIQQHLLWIKSCVYSLLPLAKIEKPPEFLEGVQTGNSASRSDGILKVLDPKKIIAFAKDFFAREGRKIVFQKNPSGFIRAHLPVPQDLPFSDKISNLRIHYWPADEVGMDFVEAAHSHPKPFISLVLQGGYEHELCEEAPAASDPNTLQYLLRCDADYEDCRVYRVLKDEKNRQEKRDLISLGRTLLSIKMAEPVKEDDVLDFPLSLIHRVKKYQPETLTINLVLKTEVNAPSFFNIYTSGNVDPLLERESFFSGKTAEMVERITTILDRKLQT